MANTTLTPDIILRKCLQVLHAKLNFIGSINRNYDDQFASSGGKSGESIRIRLPEKYTVTDGAILDVQDSTEQSTTLTQSTRKHVGMNFSTQELTMSIDDFTERKIVPAMSVLASTIEADALTMALDIYNTSTAADYTKLLPFLNAKTKLNQYLAPRDQNRMALVDSATAATMVEGLKGLFQADTELSKQYREGVMGRTAGFTFAENDLLPVLTTGTRTATTPVFGSVSGADISLTGTGNAATFKKGDIFTIADVYAVHPETKAAYSHLQQFVVTANATGEAGGNVTLTCSPTIVSSGAYQNVSVAPTAGATIVWYGAVSTNFVQNLAYHKDAFAFASADLEMPQGVHFSARKVIDGISMRIVRQYDINNDKIPARIDVLYGYKTIRPELAARVTTMAAVT